MSNMEKDKNAEALKNWAKAVIDWLGIPPDSYIILGENKKENRDKIYCPVKAEDCRYYFDNGECGIEDPYNECEDFYNSVEKLNSLLSEED